MTLTPEQAKFATRLFRSKGIPQSRIAKLFGVDRTVIRQTIREQTRGNVMNDGVDLTGLSTSQRKLVNVIQRHATRILDEELREPLLSIRTAMADIQTRVETQLQTYAQRLDTAIANAEKHEGMMT